MPVIHFRNDDVSLEVEPGTTVSSAATQAEASIPFGCRAGTCGACALSVEAGEASLEPRGFVEEDTLAVVGEDGPGRRLGCQLFVADEDLTLSW